jgi:hypothetical protein
MVNDISLYDFLRTGYTNNKEDQTKTLGKYGYIRDNELSNNQNQIYYNPQDKKLLFGSNGTQNTLDHFLKDWSTNAYIGLGLGQSTSRYQEDKNDLEKAKKKYSDAKDTTLIGHSQAGYFLDKIAGPNDKIITYNPASNHSEKNETIYRTKFDPVSILDFNTKHTKTIDSNPFQGFLKEHDLNNLKNKKIYI